jgi:hypothetical protein
MWHIYNFVICVSGIAFPRKRNEIGRASCRERVC